MSVVIEDEDGNCFVYCKGSPKLIERRSQNWSLPADYQEKVIDVCRDGLRLLSFGFKQVSKDIVFKSSRKELESKLGNKYISPSYYAYLIIICINISPNHSHTYLSPHSPKQQYFWASTLWTTKSNQKPKKPSRNSAPATSAAL